MFSLDHLCFAIFLFGVEAKTKLLSTRRAYFLDHVFHHGCRLRWLNGLLRVSFLFCSFFLFLRVGCGGGDRIMERQSSVKPVNWEGLRAHCEYANQYAQFCKQESGFVSPDRFRLQGGRLCWQLSEAAPSFGAGHANGSERQRDRERGEKREKRRR